MTETIRCYINNKPREILSARIEKNGTRAIDSAGFMFPRNVQIAKGDKLYFLSDAVGLRNLTAVWNLQSATRDEGGRDLDGLEDSNATTGTFVDGCDGKVLMFTNSTSKSIKVNSSSYIDFSGQFDIIIWAGIPSGSTAGYIFSKGTANTYIQISHTARSSSTCYAKAEIRYNGGSITTITGSNVDLDTTGDANTSERFHFIRLKRDSNGLITLSVDGTSEGTATLRDDFTTTEPLYIGGDRQGNNKPSIRLAQVRLYTGGCLSDEQFNTLKSTRRQPNTIKFGGTVWKVDEKPSYKNVYCKGFAKVFHDTEINTGDVSISSNWTTSDSDIVKNVYKNKNGVEILQDLMSVFDTGIKVIDVDGNMNSNYTEYTARGTLFENLVILTINGTNDSSFSIDGRKVLRLEDDDIDFSSGNTFSVIKFKQGDVQVQDLGLDDSNTVTSVTAIGNIPKLKKEQVKQSGDFNLLSNTAVQLQYKPVDAPTTMTVTRSSGGTDTVLTYSQSPSNNTQFKVDVENKYLILGASPSSGNYTINYHYEDLQYGTNYVTLTGGGDHSSVGTIGKTLFIPQITNATGGVNLNNFANRYKSKFSTLNRRMSVKIPNIANHIRENYNVKIIDDVHGISETTASIKSLVYNYPIGNTEVNLGDHVLDSYDLDSALGASVHELRSTFTSTQPS